MRYAVNYHTSFKHFDVVDEVIIEYSNDKQRAALLKFMKNKVRDDLRVIIAAEKLEDILPEDIDTFKAVQEIHPNFSVRIGLNHKHMMVDFVDNDIPYFYDVFVDSWDMLNGMIRYGVSDVYIVNEFAFYLPQIKKNCGDEVKIRVFPNVSQSTDKLHALSTITSFLNRHNGTCFAIASKMQLIFVYLSNSSIDFDITILKALSKLYPNISTITHKWHILPIEMFSKAFSIFSTSSISTPITPFKSLKQKSLQFN